MKIQLLLFFIFLSLSACRTNPVIPNGPDASTLINKPVPENQAFIYIIRESGMLGAAGTWDAYVDDTNVGAISNGTVILVKVSPGQHTITPNKEFMLGKATNLITKVDLKAGQRYFYQHNAEATSWLSMDFRYVPISNDTGLSMSQSYQVVAVHDLAKAEPINLIACKNWSKTGGITDIDKAWSDISKNINTLRTEILKVKNPAFNYDYPVKINNVDIPYSRLITGVNVISKVGEGDYSGAAKEVASEGLAYLVPIAGQYKALLDATKTSIDAVISNWTADLYVSESYRELADIINQEVVRGRRHKKPYYPSDFLSPSTKIYHTMWDRERSFFVKWKESAAYDRDFGFGDDVAYDKNSLFGMASRSQNNRARIRQALGKEAHPSEIYRHFYRKIVNDQKDYIEITYNETIEDMMFWEHEKMRPKIVSSVCSQLDKLANSK